MAVYTSQWLYVRSPGFAEFVCDASWITHKFSKVEDKINKMENG